MSITSEIVMLANGGEAWTGGPLDFFFFWVIIIEQILSRVAT